MKQVGQNKRTPGGLLLPMRATLTGKVKWQVLDERGIPEVPRSPSGFPLAPVEGVEQPNLITDLGLDQIAEFNCLLVQDNSSMTWRRYLAVGTGSTAPANGDTTLNAEVQRAASAGTFSDGSITYELDDVSDVWRAESLVTRLVTMTADRNLSEFGLSPEAADAIGIRELLRDGVGDPITVSLLTDKTLRLDHTLTVEIAAPETGNAATINIAQYDAGNNLVGNTPQDIIHGGRAYDANNIDQVFSRWNPALLGFNYFGRITSVTAYTRLGTTLSASPEGSSAANGFTSSLEAYVSGSHQRVKRATAGAATANGDFYGFHFTQAATSAAQYRSGWLVLLDNPTTYTKTNTDTLRAGLVSSWARAA